MTETRTLGTLAAAATGLSLLVLAGCAGGGDEVRVLVGQLEGGRCVFHTEPTHEQLDETCKRHDWNTWGLRLGAGRHQCALWAAECLGQMGDAARPSVESLVAALETGPDNYDTGDGVIPTRDAIAHALGRIGDARALDPLLDALRHPRPVEVGPGAVGYASDEPVGQVAALEALGYLGPAAVPALPEIFGILELPVETSRDERRFRAAADALAGIGDPRGIPALARHLEDPRKWDHAARGLGEFGSRAAAVGPLLVAQVERTPDAEGNEALRIAVRRVLGAEAAEGLPPNFSLQLATLWRRVADVTKHHACRDRALHVDSARAQFTTQLDRNVRLVVDVDRKTWVEQQRVAGRITPVLDDAPVAPRTFESLATFDAEVQSLVGGFCEATQVEPESASVGGEDS